MGDKSYFWSLSFLPLSTLSRVSFYMMKTRRSLPHCDMTRWQMEPLSSLFPSILKLHLVSSSSYIPSYFVGRLFASSDLSDALIFLTVKPKNASIRAPMGKESYRSILDTTSPIWDLFKIWKPVQSMLSIYDKIELTLQFVQLSLTLLGGLLLQVREKKSVLVNELSF